MRGSGHSTIGGDVTFRMVWFRPMIIAFFVLLSCGAALLLLAAILRGDTEPAVAVFIVLWLCGALWTAYWFLFRVAFEIGVVDGSTLHWRTVVALHQAPLASIQRVDTPFAPLGTGLRRIRLEGRRSPLLMGLPGIGEIFDMILAIRPDVPVNTSWYDRAYERFAIRNVHWVQIVKPVR